MSHGIDGCEARSHPVQRNMPTAGVLTRRAGHGDLEALVATLAASHLDYAWERWAVTGPDRSERLAAAFRSDLDQLALPHGVVTSVDGGAAVAVWLPAGVERLLTDRQRRDRELQAAAVFSDRLAIIEEVDALVRAAPCPPADWHLATMGTRPARQRQGLGSAVLRPMLEELDEHRQTARLETSAVDNVRFYARHGFDVVNELDLPHGAPTTWIMHRRPNAAE